ncbi:TRAP transporter small permease subunit [Thalassospira sp.]|uniref:TRAP transporter small permease subunit n=1 Tax=Thalassospira sp. TaxID=1912094 RepID=UPI002734D3DD|nr:TRAP transporter small permease [Thalassospira sp.]MDP2699697.1 TRAP transporter small permease [Thalassospira sp.]
MTDNPKIAPTTPPVIDETAIEIIGEAPPPACPESGILGRIVDKTGPFFALCFLVSMGVLITEIFMRHVFNRPTLWAHETTIFLCAIGFVFGGLYCAAHNKHIRVVILYDIVGPHTRRGLDIAISLICALSSAFFAWAAWQMVGRAVFFRDGGIHLETTGSAFNAPYPGVLKIFMLVVLVILTVQFIVLAINYARAPRPSDPAADNPSAS